MGFFEMYISRDFPKKASENLKNLEVREILEIEKILRGSKIFRFRKIFQFPKNFSNFENFSKFRKFFESGKIFNFQKISEFRNFSKFQNFSIFANFFRGIPGNVHVGKRHSVARFWSKFGDKHGRSKRATLCPKRHDRAGFLGPRTAAKKSWEGVHGIFLGFRPKLYFLAKKTARPFHFLFFPQFRPRKIKHTSTWTR